MRTGITLTVLILLLVTAFYTGCLGNSTANKNMAPAPVPEAVELHNKGLDAYVNGNYSAALDLYNQSIAADSNYTVAWLDKGNVLMQLNRSAEAIAAYDETLSRENDLAPVWNSRGKALMATGNYSAARDSFNRALQIVPDFTEAKENRDLAIKKMK